MIDLWVQDKFGVEYDKDGLLATQGKIIPTLLEQMLKDEYFNLPAPKSTGKGNLSFRMDQHQLITNNQTDASGL